MILGLDIGRQFVKAVLLEKTRGGTKVLNTGIPVSYTHLTLPTKRIV